MSGGQLLKWFILIFAGLWFIWFFTGGPERQSSQAGTYIKPPSEPLTGSWNFYNKELPFTIVRTSSEKSASEEIREDLEKAQEKAGVSVYNDKIILKNGDARDTNFDREYLVLEASDKNTDKINITGWTLTSVITGNKITIGKASYLPYTSKVNYQENIFLSPGDKVYMVTGRSPIGTSFRTNICTGYFEQFQNFTPYLKKECPEPEDEDDFVISGPNRLNDDCIDYVERIPKCELVTKSLPLDMQYECGVYITSEINYNSCVKKHKNESDFYKSEWRIFLDREYTLWKDKRETIKLLDANENLVDTITY
ncbi:hypothetical protein KKC45_00895 [Patescibacteria group bacterium]|nr:hypothetical protein [Patescibacteria group bacterium]